MTQQANPGLGRLPVQVSRSHTMRHTQGLTSRQLVAEAAAWTTHNNTSDEHLFPQLDSNPLSQESSCLRPMT